MATGRNDPCPCGSGKKFKACCLPLGRRLQSSTEPIPDDPAQLFRHMRAIALARGGNPELADLRAAAGAVTSYCLSPAAREDPALLPLLTVAAVTREILETNEAEEDELVDLFFPRLAFDVLVGARGQTAADLFLHRHGSDIPHAAVEAIHSLIEAEDAICRVVRHGREIWIENVRTRERLPAPDGWTCGAEGITCRLAKYRDRHVPVTSEVIDDPEDPWYLESQDEAAEAARYFLRKLKVKLRSRLKGVALGEELIEMSLNAAEEMEEMEAPAAAGPEVRNTDGEELVFTALRWDVVDEAKARAVLSEMEGLELDEVDEGREDLSGTFLRKKRAKEQNVIGDGVTIGRLSLRGQALSVETNSAERAEKLRRRLEKALGRSAVLRSVTSEPLEEALGRPVDPAAAERARLEHAQLMANPEVRQALAEMARKHSLAWCDTVIPALGNRRPRSLVKTESGRKKVEALLEDFAARQAHRPDDAVTMDLDLIRRELGLPPRG